MGKTNFRNLNMKIIRINPIANRKNIRKFELLLKNGLFLEFFKNLVNKRENILK